MALIDVTIPTWVTVIAGLLGAGFIGGILKDAFNKFVLSKKERSEQKSIDANTFGKTFDQGTVIYQYVQKELSRLVNIETEKLRFLISEKEIKHFEEINDYKNQVVALRKRVAELEDQVRNCVKLKE